MQLERSYSLPSQGDKTLVNKNEHKTCKGVNNFKDFLKINSEHSPAPPQCNNNEGSS